MKIVINVCFGGFSLSELVYNEMGIQWDGHGYLTNKAMGIESDNTDQWRYDPRLIEAIERVGEDNAGGGGAKIKIVSIPGGVDWEIEDRSGVETIHEVHRAWA